MLVAGGGLRSAVLLLRKVGMPDCAQALAQAVAQAQLDSKQGSADAGEWCLRSATAAAVLPGTDHMTLVCAQTRTFFARYRFVAVAEHKDMSLVCLETDKPTPMLLLVLSLWEMDAMVTGKKLDRSDLAVNNGALCHFINGFM